jgi:hypothetical protein
MKLQWIAALGLMVLVTSSCRLDINCVDGEGPTEERVYDLPPLRGFNIETHANVRLRQGPQEVIIIGAANVLEELDIDVRNGILIIDDYRCIRDEVDVLISLPDYDRIELEGSGTIFSEEILFLNDLDLRLEGSGDIDLALDIDDLEATISGSGDIFLEGTGDDLDLVISGSGEFNAFNYFVEDADVRISGSGEAEVYVEESLDVLISGSGNVLFKGNPLLDIRITGSGQVIDAN